MQARKRPWWQATTSPKLAAVIGGCWLIAGVGELVGGCITGTSFAIVVGSVFLLCGVPYYITTFMLLRRCRAVGSTRFPSV